jgi:hypothetical protein
MLALVLALVQLTSIAEGTPDSGETSSVALPAE